MAKGRFGSNIGGNYINGVWKKNNSSLSTCFLPFSSTIKITNNYILLQCNCNARIFQTHTFETGFGAFWGFFNMN